MYVWPEFPSVISSVCIGRQVLAVLLFELVQNVLIFFVVALAGDLIASMGVQSVAGVLTLHVSAI